MTYRITETCLNCGGCIDECPQGAIIEGEEKSSIDPEKCNDCGYCVENLFCPGFAFEKVEESG